MAGVTFLTDTEMRILSAALCIARDEAADGSGMYEEDDEPTIRVMKHRVDAELESRYRVRKATP